MVATKLEKLNSNSEGRKPFAEPPPGPAAAEPPGYPSGGPRVGRCRLDAGWWWRIVRRAGWLEASLAWSLGHGHSLRASAGDAP